MSPEELRNVANNCNVATNQAILIDDAADAWERDRAELERLRTNLADTTIAWEQDRAERDSLRKRVEELEGLLREGLDSGGFKAGWYERARRALEAKE